MRVMKNLASGEVTQESNSEPVPIPARITRHQFRRALSAINAGRRSQLEAWLANGASEADKDYFRDAAWVSRNSVAVENARIAINASNAAVDNLFAAALQYDE